MYDGYFEDEYSEEQFFNIYSDIKENLIVGNNPGKDKCTIILGGQPGAGKSSFYGFTEGLYDYVPINGDEYRRFHPNIDSIIKTDPEHYAERTQSFSNRVVESLISDLGNKGYNLVIEGTLRNPDVSITTCNFLREKGYNPELVVIACDAEEAWLSTIKRAVNQEKNGQFPRLVPIDIYNNTVHQIPDSLSVIEEAGCFSSISILDRQGNVIYYPEMQKDPVDILRESLNLHNWDQKYLFYENDFIETKISILKSRLSENRERTELQETETKYIEKEEDESHGRSR